MTDHASLAEVNGYVAEITDAFQAAATQINTNKSSNKLNQDNNHKPWFGKECKTARRNYHLAKRIHHNIKSDENRANLLEASKHYKKTMNKFINKYTKSKCNKLRHKNKGDASDPENYRPITLLSCLGKLFTALLSDRLNFYVEENVILKENQAGFRKDYSTIDHIFVLHALTKLLQFEKKKLFCSFIDFSKAFDSVWRVGLGKKLLRDDINENFFRVIYNIYNNIKSCVSGNNESSSFFVTNCGVRQGDNLSPIHFSMLLHDLEDHMDADNLDGITLDFNTDELFVFTKLYVLLYADDTIILADNETSFQQSLNSFNNYCEVWKLKINKDKSKVMIFGAKKTDCFNFYIGKTKLEIVNAYKYLGTYFAPSGSFLTARKHIAAQAQKAMHLLNLRIHNLNLPVDLQLKLFDHTVLPIMTYGCEVWGFENCEILERIHNKFLRSILQVRQSTTIYMLYAELGRHPIEITIKTRMIAFWSRLISSKQSKLSYFVYHKMLNTPRFQSKWVNNIKSILTSCGRSDIWEMPPLNTNIVASVKQNLIDQYYQKWHEELEDSSKGENYHLYK